ncbi:protein phosphatase 1G-like isoform X1 [Myxocyprinus asiaticus]|uniref:protein phosphatase 1G-like isoform X1 n=1 Tax=Myxocyprinus asiaticus TaxID=70543 RepID=UPI0022235988|nr:protein phosphatase 1G-like isoform X1 [Myxocyprinus asiaticus]
MGAYLSQPNTEKSTADGGNKNMSYGFAAMQGWRVSMEDAHNCIPELDDETAMFAVYDGHGGEEVALYCSKYLPDIIKEQKTYKDGKLQKALEDAFLAIDGRITTEEVIKELVQIAGRPQEETEKVADEDDVDNDEAALLHEEATMTIEELLIRYGQNMNKNAKKPCQDASKDSEDGEKSRTEMGINGETECGASADSNEKAGGAGGAAEGSKMRSCRRAAASIGGSGSASTGSAGDAGPSCSSSEAPAPGSTKSKFFEDSDESEEGVDEEEEGSDVEDCSEEEDGENSSENDEEDDTEEGEEEDTDEEEEMCLPGMDGKEEPGSDSGTTAVVALIRGKQLIVANAGDSRCVVSEKGKAVDMSYDHKPEDELELARIKNAGGKVTMDGRVNGGLNLSRAIGDHFYKRNKALPPEEQMISALPDVKVLTLNEDHEFMVIACDGIWNVMSSQEVVDFVNERLKTDSVENRPLSAIIEELLDHCLAPDTSGDGTGCDNMTCIIITFSPHLGSDLAEGTKKRKADETVAEENSSDSKKAKTE